MGSILGVPRHYSTGTVVVVPGLAAPWHVGSSWIRDQTLSPVVAGRFFTSEPPYFCYYFCYYFLNIYLLIYFWLCWVFAVACRIFTAVCELLSSYGARAPECVGSVITDCAPWHVGSWFPNQGSNPHVLLWKAES